MSVYDLLTPLSIGKNYLNINVNSINVGDGGSSLQAPVLITGNTLSGSPIITVVETNANPNNENLALQAYNQSGSAGIKILTINDPTPSSDIFTDGTFIIKTFEQTSDIRLSPNQFNALSCTYPLLPTPRPLTTIQNLQFPTVGGTPSDLNYYEEFGPLPITFTGPWGAGITYIRNVNITRIGRIVTFSLDALEQFVTGAGANADITTSGNVIPARFIPSPTADETAPVYVTIPIFDQNSSRLGSLRIQTDGTMIITSTQAAAPVFGQFQGTLSGGAKVGFPNVDISYSIV